MPSGIPQVAENVSALQFAENPILFLILGGAAVHRCDKCLVFGDGFSR
jgi:hypothetical protein